tara:strand:- start:9512 stop:10660 length:1149 start_codon:yes stop_codon:yes gene_type:complete
MPSIGKDLAKIRTSLGLTLQDIQATIKIPMATLEKIENGTIYEDSEHGKTYVRSFIRSYGRALKIDNEVMINGLNQQETGNYNQLLWNYYEAGQESSSFKNFTFDDVDPDDDPKKDQEVEAKNELKQKKATSHPSEEAPNDKTENVKDEPLNDSPSETAKPEATGAKNIQPPPTPAKNVNWADMGHKFTETKKTTPVWLFVTLILIVVIFVIGYFIYSNDLLSFSEDSVSEPDITVVSPENRSELLDLNETDEISVVNPVVDQELEEILYITVYAAYERLDPVRIWSDIKPRMDPYWVEQGVAMNFDFRDTVRIRGQYDNMLIFKNGHPIEDVLETNYNQQENYIELTRDYFSTDPKWVSNQPFQLPEEVAQPDTVMLRPTF